MNVAISDTMRDVLKEIPDAELKDWFERARQEQYQLLRVKGESATFTLTDVQARVILLDELEEYFQRARKTTNVNIIES